MNTASIFIKTEPKIKEEAKKTAEELGFSLSSILNAFLRQFVKTKTITFSTKELDERFCQISGQVAESVTSG